MDAPKEKRKYYKWTKADLKNSLRALKLKELGLNECSRRYGVPKPTLKRHLLKQNKFSNDTEISKGRPTVFPEVIERQLTSHILLMDECMLGLTMSDVRRLAFQIAEKNNIPHNFNKTKQMAGKSWYYAYKRRHPEITLRQPEKTSINRAKGFNKENVMDFYNKLEKTVDENGITANTVFNMDETGISTVQKKPQKVHSLKGKRQIACISSGERGVNTTAVCATSASGQYIPPMLIFKRKRMSPLLEKGAPPGSIVTVSDTGYINTDLFVRWLKHFIEIVKPSKEKKVLLLLDGHTTHSKNLEAILLARDNGIILLQLPGHTTHRLQPMDVAIFGPLSTYLTQAIETWMRTNHGQAVTQYEISQLFNQAYQRAATVGNAISAFRATGVWPVNRHVFQDHDFAASEAYVSQNNNEPNQVVPSTSIDAAASNSSVSKAKQLGEMDRDVDETNSIASSSTDLTTCESPSIFQNIPENDDFNVCGKNDGTSMQCFLDGIQHSVTGAAMSYQPQTLLSLTLNVFQCGNSNPQHTTFINQSSSVIAPAISAQSSTNNGPSTSAETSGAGRDTTCDERIDLNSATTSPIPRTSLSVQSSTTTPVRGLSTVSTSASFSKDTMKLEFPIHALSPMPKITAKTNKRKTKGIQKASLLTASPYKDDLEQSIKTRAAKLPKIKLEDTHNKPKTIVKKASGKNMKVSKKRENEFDNGSNGDDQGTDATFAAKIPKTEPKNSKVTKKTKILPNDIVNYGASTSGTKSVKNKSKNTSKATKKKTPRQMKTKTKVIKKYEESDDSSLSSIVEIVLDDDSDGDIEEDSDNYCAVCKGYYYDKKGPKIDWVECVRCHRWLHDNCINYLDICPMCLM